MLGGLLTLAGGFLFISGGIDKASSSSGDSVVSAGMGLGLSDGSGSSLSAVAPAATSTPVVTATSAANGSEPAPPAAPIEEDTQAPEPTATTAPSQPSPTATTPANTPTSTPPTATPVPPTSTPVPPAPTATTAPAVNNGGGSTSLLPMEAAMFSDHNAERAKAGLGGLQIDARLVAIARQRAQDMASNNYFSHTSPSGQTAFTLLAGAGYVYAIAGENIARNNYPDAQSVGVAMTGFMNSSGHRANILDGRYQSIGVGMAVGADGMKYFAVIFAGN